MLTHVKRSVCVCPSVYNAHVKTRTACARVLHNGKGHRNERFIYVAVAHKHTHIVSERDTGTDTHGQRNAIWESVPRYAHRQSIKIICIIHHSSVITRCVLKLKSCATRIERASPRYSCAKEFQIEKPFRAEKHQTHKKATTEIPSAHRRSFTHISWTLICIFRDWAIAVLLLNISIWNYMRNISRETATATILFGFALCRHFSCLDAHWYGRWIAHDMPPSKCTQKKNRQTENQKRNSVWRTAFFSSPFRQNTHFVYGKAKHRSAETQEKEKKLNENDWFAGKYQLFDLVSVDFPIGSTASEHRTEFSLHKREFNLFSTFSLSLCISMFVCFLIYILRSVSHAFTLVSHVWQREREMYNGARESKNNSNVKIIHAVHTSCYLSMFFVFFSCLFLRSHRVHSQQ